MNINISQPLKISNSLNDLTGPGTRTVLYVQGCIFKCNGCNYPDGLDLTNGILKNNDELVKEILSIGNNLTITGGEPILQARECLDIVKKIKEKRNLNIWLYTGFTFEELIKTNNNYIISLLDNINILVDGQFEMDNKIGGISLKGSTNQRILDSKMSLALNTPIIVTSYDKHNRYNI